MPLILPSIYAITGREQSLGRSAVTVAKDLVAAGIRILQYREKHLSRKAMLDECLAIREITKESGCLFIVNDYVDIALICGADGVHVGQDDLPVEAVRRITPAKMLVGVSASTLEEARKGMADGADYLGVGAIFATGTKTDAQVTGLDGLREIVAASSVPVVAIGGINKATLPEVLATGVRSCAMISALTSVPDIAAGVQEMHALFLDTLS